VFWWVLGALRDSSVKVVVEQGGTSSGKTYAIMQVLAYLALHKPRTIITVVGQDYPNLRRGAMRDLTRIIGESPALYKALTNRDKAERIFYNGSVIEFAAFETAQDAKSGKRDYLFVNEANGVDFDIYEALSVRTRKVAFVDYNATAPFWVHDRLIGAAGVVTHISNFTNNQYCPKPVIEKILAYKGTDPYRWRVYGMGLTGVVESERWLDAFNPDRHVDAGLQIRATEPLLVSIDFNVGKFVAIAIQCSDLDDGKHSFFHVVDEIVLQDANIEKMATVILRRWGRHHLLITGDQSGARRDTGYSSSNDTLLSILQQSLGVSRRQMLFGAYNPTLYPSKNPSHKNSWGHCNNVLAQHPHFKISGKCVELIQDCSIATFSKRGDFALKKGAGDGTWAMNALDCLRYAIHLKCPSYDKVSSIRNDTNSSRPTPSAVNIKQT